MQLLAYLGGLGAALLLAFYLPSHLLSVREQMRTQVSESKTVRTAAPPRESRATSGANPSEKSDNSRESERVSERPVSAGRTLATSPPASVSEPLQPQVPRADARRVSVDRTLPASPPAPLSEPLQPPVAQAVTRNSEHNSKSKPKLRKKVVVITQAKTQNKAASQTRIARVPPKRQESEITASLDGLEFWWKKPSKKERGGERMEARYADPTEFWWR
jgi:hypothetical protein